MSVNEILTAVKEGRKDFSHIICREADFTGRNLSGCNFSHSDLSYSGFDHTNLTDADFSECNLEWTSFRFANLTRTKFFKARITYSVLNNAILKSTDMRNADLSWSLMFDCTVGEVDWKGAMIATLATDPSQITEEGVKHVERILGKIGINVSLSTALAIRFSMDKTKGTFALFHEVPKTVSRYAKDVKIGFGYGAGGETTYGKVETGTYAAGSAKGTSSYEFKAGYGSSVAEPKEKKHKVEYKK